MNNGLAALRGAAVQVEHVAEIGRVVGNTRDLRKGTALDRALATSIVECECELVHVLAVASETLQLQRTIRCRLVDDFI